MKILITVECSSPLDAEYVDRALHNTKCDVTYGQVVRDIKWSQRVVRETVSDYEHLSS